MEKERVDVLLVQQGLFDTREKAKRAVMAGEILGVNEERLDKPGMKIPVATELHLKGKPMPYVSRGGLKLEKALKSFEIDWWFYRRGFTKWGKNELRLGCR